MIALTLNGQKIMLAHPYTVQHLLDVNGYAAMTVAVAVNGVFVPKAQHEINILTGGEEIDIVAPMQGG